jgi:predicted nucleic acid-binding protein
MEEPGSDAARSILESGDLLAAPDLIIVEACNGAWKAVRQQLMTTVQADSVSRRLAVAFDALRSHPSPARVDARRCRD